MKSIKAWLETLPDGYRERALKNMHAKEANIEQEDLGEALMAAFHWRSTSEGVSFWGGVYDWTYLPGAALPPLPGGGAA